jgi:UDP-N-acetylmuramoylalanine-D-glutamate ligase
VPAGVTLPPPLDEIAFNLVEVPAGDLRASNAAVAATTALTAAARWDTDAGGTPADRPTPAELAAELLAAYPDLPGRLSTVATAGDVVFVDDALASNPLGLAAGLGSAGPGPVAAIVGGTDRGASVEPVLAAIRARPGRTICVCIDDARAGAGRYAEAGAEVVVADDLESAVAMASAALGGHGTVLFSPGMPTPDPQGNWSDRSRRFRSAAQRAGGAS